MTKQRYLLLINLAKRKLREGDRTAAKKIAQFIVTNYPEGLEGWLILGGLSKGEDALNYLHKAEKLAPEDSRVKQALTWANAQSIKTLKEKDVRHTLKLQPHIIPTQPLVEERASVWLWALAIIIILSLLFLGMGILPRYPNRVSSHYSLLQSTNSIKPTLSATPNFESADNLETVTTLVPSPTPTITFTPTPTATPTIIPDLYGCDMELRFISGPLDGTGTTFTMIDRSYFYDKGDKFDTGKNTGLFYEDQRYLILHSGYLGGNLSNPLEIEFLRKYLELWGNNDKSYIEQQIQSLLGSEMVWICDAQETINLKLAEVVRLSHQSSNELWLNPTDILQIIEEKGGDSSEWIGDIEATPQNSVYLGFCGWGPPEITQDRSIYYRYVFRFDIFD
ncbi:MAG: hypothetical protein SVR94_16665 [Pseudomonadota bacterium]|nr:hypothetical protein [Pseudomonadota bacterium]